MHFGRASFHLQVFSIFFHTKLTTVLKQNYFEHGGEFYQQNEGLAMGSPLSCILAEIFLNHIENTHILNERNIYLPKITFYYRYIDDILCLYKGNPRQIDIFKKKMNRIHPNLKFTSEIEENKSLNFLDLTITKTNKLLTFKIYRKPTQTSHTIHSTSNHPQSHKAAAYHSYIHRLLSIPMNQNDYITELNTIKNIAIENGYQPKMVDKILRKHKKNPTTKKELNEMEKKYTVIEYDKDMYHTHRKTFRSLGYTTAFKTTNNLKSILSNNKETNNENKLRKTGIYKITCDNCPKHYIGQTGRTFETRFKEHIPHKNHKSKFADHLMETGHSISGLNHNLTILKLCQKSKKMDVIEQFEIYKSFKENPHYILNEKTDFHSNELFDTAIHHQKRRRRNNIPPPTQTKP